MFSFSFSKIKLHKELQLKEQSMKEEQRKQIEEKNSQHMQVFYIV